MLTPLTIPWLQKVLNHSEFCDISAEDLADAIWLAAHCGELPHDEAKVTAPKIVPNEPLPPLINSAPEPAAVKPSLPQSNTQDLSSAPKPIYPVAQSAKQQPEHSVSIPAGKALPHTLVLSRLLRPLRHLSESKTLQIDEQATAQYIAETQHWLPVLTPCLEVNLELLLVVDQSASMQIWQRTIEAWQQVLIRTGAFRSVKNVKLQVEKDTGQFSLLNGGRSCHFSSLSKVGAERLILLLTDGVSPIWQNTSLWQALDDCGKRSSIAILQLFPQRLWSQTRLHTSRYVKAIAGVRAEKNKNIRWQPLIGFTHKTEENKAAIPIFSLESANLKAWVNFFTGKKGATTPALIYRQPIASDRVEPRSVQTAEQSVKSFQQCASIEAFNLACFFASAPLYLPVMRLIQHVMAPETTQVHFAEFYLSGLIKRVSPSDGDNSDEVQYEFIDGVREQLLKYSLQSEALNVLDTVSQYVEQNWGGVAMFRASVHSDKKECFARVEKLVLEKMGVVDYENIEMPQAPQKNALEEKIDVDYLDVEKGSLRSDLLGLLRRVLLAKVHQARQKNSVDYFDVEKERLRNVLLVQLRSVLFEKIRRGNYKNIETSQVRRKIEQKKENDIDYSDVKKRLQALSKKQCIALAARLALRVLPFLAIIEQEDADISSVRLKEEGDLLDCIRHDNVVLSASRRQGKTHLLYRIADGVESQGYLGLVISADGAYTIDRFIETLRRLLPDQVLSDLFSEKNKKVELGALGWGGWQHKLLWLQKHLTHLPVIFLVDNFDVLLNSLAEQDLAWLLNWLREWRMSDTACRFVFSVAIDLDTLLKETSLIACFNDCRVYKLKELAINFGKKQQYFSFWFHAKKTENVLSMFRACASAINYAINSFQNSASDIVEAAEQAKFDLKTNNPVIQQSVNTIFEAADLYAYIDYLAIEHVEDMVLSFSKDVDLFEQILLDLSSIESLSIEEFFNRPLYQVDAWQAGFDQFKSACLSLNAGFDVWLDWYEERLLGKPIDFNSLEKWLNVPAEIEGQGPAAVNAYLSNLQQSLSAAPLNRVRAIFIGYGEAGKTSLIRVLNGQPLIAGDDPMMPGIAISDWPIPNTEIKANFWDFGGQVMAHVTYQFFLRERCLYVLMINARSEVSATEQAEYWLEHVRIFGKNAPVMMVGNKADLARLNLDMAYLTHKYSNIVGYYPLSCTEAYGRYQLEYQTFHRDFCSQLKTVGMHQMMFTQPQFAVLQQLQQLNKTQSFLRHQDFDALCQQHGITDKGVQNKAWLLDILDKLGIVIHFPQLDFLDEFVLNPRWLTHGVYSLMYEQQPRLTQQQVVAILKDKVIEDGGHKLTYPVDKCRFLMDAMVAFKLCYRLPHDTKQIIIPELLPTDQPPNIPFDKQGALVFEFVFRGFLPRNILPEFIVDQHTEIDDEIVWQRGVLLRSKQFQAQALVQVDYHARLLTIWVTGKNGKSYLAILNDCISSILGRMNVDYQESVVLPAAARVAGKSLFDGDEKALYRQLLAFLKEGKRYFFAESGSKYDLQKVMEIILPDSFSYSYTKGYRMINQHVVNSTVHGSVVAAETIQDSFNQLKESKAESAVQELLTRLLKEIEVLNSKVPAAQADTLENLADDANNLIKQTQRAQPDKKRFQVSLEGIKEAAVALKEAGQPIWALATELSQVLGV